MFLSNYQWEQDTTPRTATSGSQEGRGTAWKLRALILSVKADGRIRAAHQCWAEEAVQEGGREGPTG